MFAKMCLGLLLRLVNPKQSQMCQYFSDKNHFDNILSGEVKGALGKVSNS